MYGLWRKLPRRLLTLRCCAMELHHTGVCMCPLSTDACVCDLFQGAFLVRSLPLQDCTRDFPSVLVLGGALGPVLRLLQGRGASPWFGVHTSSLALPVNPFGQVAPFAGSIPLPRCSPLL